MLVREFIRFTGVLAIMLLLVVSATWAAQPESRAARITAVQYVDNTSYINANKILMFVTNHGNFGRDMSDVFGYDYGTYYPYTSVEDISSGEHTTSPFYSGGIWIGGVDSATGDTLVTVSEYESEYVPGPMKDGTYQPDQVTFRVYHLYSDSTPPYNPNDDYLNWPCDQGAPSVQWWDCEPAMIGDQMLWTVYNDADPSQHWNMETAPLGVEIQQTAWAFDEVGEIEIPGTFTVPVQHTVGTGRVTVAAYIRDREALTGHDYAVVTALSEEDGYHWHLIDVTLDDTVLARQPFSESEVLADGVGLRVTSEKGISSFEVVANGAGPLDPPEPGAASFGGFPVPTELDPNGYPTANQQVGDGSWFIHTADNGGSCGDGTRDSYEDFLERVLRLESNSANVGDFDYEMRFTGSHDNPGVGGGYAIEWYNDENVFWVPFELWRVGVNTPDEPSDDIRMVPFIIDDGDDDVFGLESWGCVLDATYGGDGEHSVSGANDDPFTDWVYWRMPTDSTPGTSGYDANEASMLAGTYDGGLTVYEVFARMVLVNWNGGDAPPFTQDIPEMGTVFRILTTEAYPGEVFSFSTASLPPMTSGPEGMSIYLKYRLINKGSRHLKDFYISLWADPDVGGSGDDLVGCDTLNGVFYAYNATDTDSRYGATPPAVGFKVLEGPIVPSAGDTAMVDGIKVPGYRNLGMYSFNMYINGMDPDYAQEAYWYMQGRDAKNNGAPIIDPITGRVTRYVLTGDPVTGAGWLDTAPDDRRMMASFGPFDFRPGDTQQVLFKFAVGQGTDRLNSITSLREILDYERTPTPVDPPVNPALPVSYSLGQNYPNPFNPSTTIKYTLPRKEQVRIELINLLGQRVATLVDETLPAGEHTVMWNGTDDSGAKVASGVYFYRLTAGEYVNTRKMMLLK